MNDAALYPDADLTAFEARAAEAAALLKVLASKPRLHILCRLMKAGETPVGELAASVGLSQSALSQHLAKLREEGLVAARRAAQTIYYRVDDPRTARILDLLADIYC